MTWWSPCHISRMHAQGGIWSRTSKWERRTIKEKRWDDVRRSVWAKHAVNTFVLFFISGSHTPAVVPLQWLLNRTDWQGEPFCFISISEICLRPCNFTVALKTEAVQFDVSWKVPAILYYAKRNYHTKYDLRSKFTDFKTLQFTCVIHLLFSAQLKIP